jgi:hypothetical protein
VPNIVLEYLNPEWIERRLVELDATVGRMRDPADETAWSLYADACRHRCELEHVRGAPPAKIRTICRDFVTALVPFLKQADFSTQKHSAQRMVPSRAKELAETYGGTWQRIDQHYAAVTWEQRRQPLDFEMPHIWMMACVGGDQDLANSIAEPYLMDPPGTMDQHEELRHAMLRHCLAGDDRLEQSLVDQLKPGYLADFPRDLIEFPIGVIKRDPSLLRTAVRKTCTAFKGKWDVRKHRVWYDRQVKKYPPGKWRHPGTWERVLERTKSALIAHRYAVSWWALAWMNIAHWRGIDNAFKDPKIFSEFVPRALCE